MIRTARNAGAFAARCTRQALLLICSLAGVTPLLAAEVRLLHADPATVQRLAPATSGELVVRFEGRGRTHELHLQPNHGMGALQQRVAGRAQAYRGKVGNIADSWAALTRIDGRWSGIWYDGGDFYGVDSAGALADASEQAAAMDPRQVLVYRLRDAVWEAPELENDTLAPAQNGAQLVRGMKSGLAALRFGEPARLSVAVVADALLSRQDGDATEAHLLARLNLIDGLFASQLGVQIEAASVTLFTRHADEPFGRTTEASDLLEEIADWRATDATQRGAGLTHVFTGRNLSGRTVGMAYIGALCSRRYSTSLSQATASTTFAALIAAHEIGHVFGAPHDGETGSACATTPTDFLMAPRINGSQQFSQCSLDQIAPRIEAAVCLSPLPSGGGVFDPDDTPDQGGGGSLGLSLLAALALLAWRRSQMRANHSAR
ncbi:MAG TPA: M12 family metallo-peptidase [Steroidobacteraceae bacterium]|nr:M12 family metallo-peptidase [Steroidobacteraceae bacterium]